MRSGGERNVGDYGRSSGGEHVASGGPTLGATEFDHMVSGCLPVSPLCRYLFSSFTSKSFIGKLGF